MIDNWEQKEGNILITANRSISSKYVFHTICDIADSFYKELKNNYNVYFLSQYSTVDKVYKLFSKECRNVFFDEVILLNDFTNKLDYTTSTNWQDIYEELDVSSLPKFDRIIEIGSALSEASHLKRNKINKDKLFQNNSQFKFLSVRKIKEVLLTTYKISKLNNIKIEHYIIDPQELDYNDIDCECERYFPYTSEIANFERHDAFLNYYKNLDNINVEKSLDFVFGYTILTQDRVNNIHEIITNKLNDYNIKLFLRDKYNNIDTFVKKDEYLEYIRQAKFTLIIPAYDSTTFSVFRYIESIYNDCIPLILDTNNLEEVKESLYIPDEIIININNIDEKIKNLNYEEILKDIKNKL